jgi:hypothetical protein
VPPSGISSDARRHVDEGIAGDRQRVAEVLAAGVHEPARQLRLVGKRDGVDHEIEAAPCLAQLGETGIHRRVVHHVHIDQQRGTDRGRQRLHPLAEGLTLVGKRKLRAFGMQRLGDAPCDRAFVGHAHDEPALALHQIRHVRLSVYRLSSIEPFVPPKPKELVITVSRPAFSTRDVAISWASAPDRAFRH